MQNPAYVYRLSHVPAPAGDSERVPYLLLTVPGRFGGWLNEIFTAPEYKHFADLSNERARTYLGRETLLHLPFKVFEDTFPIRRFGYGGKIFVLRKDGEYQFFIMLECDHLDEVMISLQCLLLALSHILSEEVANRREQGGDERRQMINLLPACSHEVLCQGHLIQGEAYPALTRWLSNKGQHLPEGWKYAIPSATAAVQDAWLRLHPKAVRADERECNVQLWDNGHFLVQIPDRKSVRLSDMYRINANEAHPLSSGNLDTANQQLAVLAGLAALLDLAALDLSY